MSAGKIVLLVFGILVVFVAAALISGGATVIWVDREHTDSEGFIVSDPIHVERDSYAAVTGPIEIDETALRVLDFLGWVTAFKVEGSNNDPLKGFFAGIADEPDLVGYLNNVNYDERETQSTGPEHRPWNGKPR
jgi:hypothetical protein